MRILDKYIIKFFLLSFFYCLFLFIFLYIIIDLFGHLDEVLKHSVPISILGRYYLSMIPLIIVQTAPIASLISTIQVIGTMNKYDEITAMRTAGISIFRILAPFIFMGLIISIGAFTISEKFIPMGMKNSQYIKENYIEKQNKNTAKKTINNITLYGKNNRLIFIRNFDIRNDTLSGITILEQDQDSNVLAKISAQEGKWTGSTWLFSNVLIYNLGRNGTVKGKALFFEEKGLDIESPGNLASKSTNYEFMNFKNLSNYINNFSNVSPDIVHRLRVDLYQKISLPFTSLVIILIGAALSVKIKRRGKNAAIIGMGMSIVIGFIYYALMAMCIALGKARILPPFISAHLVNFIFGSIGIMLIRN